MQDHSPHAAVLVQCLRLSMNVSVNGGSLFINLVRPPLLLLCVGQARPGQDEELHFLNSKMSVDLEMHCGLSGCSRPN